MRDRWGNMLFMMSKQRSCLEFNMERYRSGHNGADSKSVWRQRHVGSNPTLSANSHEIRTHIFHKYLYVRYCDIQKKGREAYHLSSFFVQFSYIKGIDLIGFYTKCWGGQRIEQKNKKKREHI